MDTPNFASLSFSLLGGLAIFILGMGHMTQALTNIAGARMKELLASFTRNRFAAAASGAAITAAVQSSSVTTVLLVGFSSAGLISVVQSVGVILGANLGSTVTAQIIAFKISEAGAILMAVGLAITFIRTRERIAQIGTLLLGLGAIFFGMQLMGDATRPLRGYQPFLEAMQAIESPLWGVAIGLVFTAIVQSSAATIGLSIIFANQQLISLEAAIAIAFGANIGTCITAAFAALGRPAAAWRVVFIHVVFNALGVALWFAFIPQLAGLSELVGEHLLHDATQGRQVAIAHTLFNLCNLILFIGFTEPLARLATRVAPDKVKQASQGGKPLYLDPLYLATPSLAIDRARMECGRLATLTVSMAEDIPHAALRGDLSDLKALARRDDQVDELQTAILNYLARIDASKLDTKAQHAINQTIALINSWENIGDLLDTHVLPLGYDRLQAGHPIGDATLETLSQLHQALLQDLRLALLVTTKGDPADIEKLLASKAAFRQLAEDAESDLRSSLVGRDPERMELFRLESDLISNFKHIHHHTRRPAKLLAEALKAKTA
ncbi:Na/Pi cotransporter family protein [Pelagicoccus sp. SDUM812005]|uniref:Na/Pi cotransporter family protein n=1 Tax=Pelagicoccus sp. SDUM812005 TaxID=3041257 RepID=UPI00280CA4DA|nr:Na/Pi cotransporter family protein [Pelagicoccus sp. SDUM812005]MDQ8181694.1 Na/Pi cotransporter family protein [Pelagicoccus sp. SDUM812005]